ncbi:helix-turn-helix domain-containing protein [Paracoccus spongiarum]|uniref:helix-turn-helix domain-containing protein n=1 Tax=Paracoccus spongiarum TaxID=3064387 RepID=UPI003531ACDE
MSRSRTNLVSPGDIQAAAPHRSCRTGAVHPAGLQQPAPRQSLAELADRTGLHKSTILRMARSMALHGFLDRAPVGRFSIGCSVWRRGLVFRQDFDTSETICPAPRDLVRLTGEKASVFVRSGRQRPCLWRENGPGLPRSGVEEGPRLKRGDFASGLRCGLIMAHPGA